MRVPTYLERQYRDLIDRIIAAANILERQRDPPKDRYSREVLR